MFQRNCCLCFQGQDTKTKHGQAINKLKIKPDLILTDAEKLSSDYTYFNIINPLNAKLNPFCHLLAVLGAHHILHISGLMVITINCSSFNFSKSNT
jgi:hypothetical protein